MLRVLLKKEFTQFRRNSFLPKLMFAFPLMVMLVMPWIMQMDVQNIRIAVVDPTESSFSRNVVSHIQASPYFIYASYSDHAPAIEAMDADKLDVIVTIPESFERKLLSGTPDPILVEANGVNAMKATQGMQYVIQIIASQLPNPAIAAGSTASVRPQQSALIASEFRYNPTQNARLYMTPALMIIVLLLICGFLPALNIVGEKESGTMEQINVMPIPRFTFILAKLIPYWIMGLVVFCVTMLVAFLVYGLVPASGWVGLIPILLGALLFIMTMSAFSVFVANICNTYQQTIFMMFFFLLCFMLLSGLLTPYESMPQVVQYIAAVFPPRYFIHIMRSVYLKGATIAMLWVDYAALAGMAVVFALIAIWTYRKQS